MGKPKEKKGKYMYDFAEDVIYIVPAKRTYLSSFQIDNFIFDLDKERKIAGLEILNASKVMHIPKIFLKNAKSGVLEIVARKNVIHIMLKISGVFRNENLRNVLNVEKINENELAQSMQKLSLKPIKIAT